MTIILPIARSLGMSLRITMRSFVILPFPSTRRPPKLRRSRRKNSKRKRRRKKSRRKRKRSHLMTSQKRSNRSLKKILLSSPRKNIRRRKRKMNLAHKFLRANQASLPVEIPNQKKSHKKSQSQALLKVETLQKRYQA